MIKLFYHALIFCIVLISFSCNQQEKVQSAFVLNAPQENSYAAYFKIYKQQDLSLLVTYLNVNKTDSVVYAIYQGKKPVLDFPVYFIETPVKKVACLSAVFVGFLDKLNVLNSIAAVDNADFISNPLIKQKTEEKQIKQLSKSGELNIEETIMSGATILFINPSGNKAKDLDKRLIDAKIIPVICADYFEQHPLGRAEWIKALSLFFSKENYADSVFQNIDKEYNSLKTSVDTCKYKPSVFTEIKTGDAWFVSGGKSSVAQLLKDAGADYVWKDTDKTETVAFSMEQVIQRSLGADYWINLHLCNTKSDLLNLDKRYAEFNAFKKGNLYNNNALLSKDGINGYWEYGLCSPQEILRDLIKIFHPNLQADHQLKYYKQIN